ncbi:MAG: helix-turn-helix domain-containing protein [Parvularculaceae bacterium]
MGDGEAPADNQSSEIGRRIRAARARAGVTRKQLAAASGASERYLAHLEAGTGNPSVEMVWSIACALDIAPAELLPHGGERSAVEGDAAKLIRRLPEELRTELLEWLRRKQEFGPGKEKRLALIKLRGAGKLPRYCRRNASKRHFRDVERSGTVIAATSQRCIGSTAASAAPI